MPTYVATGVGLSAFNNFIMELTIKHLAPYLPYDLQMYGKVSLGEKGTRRLNPSMINAIDRLVVKPILRPLSDLTKEIEHNKEKFIPALNARKKDNLKKFWIGSGHIDTHLIEIMEFGNYDTLPHWLYQDLIKWHFDVFGLIDEGLAIDINSL